VWWCHGDEAGWSNGNILCIQSRRDYIIAVKEEYKRGWWVTGWRFGGDLAVFRRVARLDGI